jgi:hypothetical protein
MPTGVFDASLITQRARAKAESNSFINRIQNPTNPRTSYGPLTGIYDNSEVNRVNNGQMKYFQRNGACTVAYIGCPCTVTTPSGQIANNVVIVAPGPVTITSVDYGSVIVTWAEPTGTASFEYTITARPLTGGGPILTNTTTGLTYTYLQGVLTPGIEYEFAVTATNDAGTGGSTNTPTIYAPYTKPDAPGVAPDTLISNQLNITISYGPFSFTQYKLFVYVNGVANTIIDWTSFTGNPISFSASPDNLYSFKVQVRDGNNYSSISNISFPQVRPYYGISSPASSEGIDTSSALITIPAPAVPSNLNNSSVVFVNGTGTTTLAVIDGSVTKFTINGLTTATEYSNFSFYLQNTVSGNTYRSIQADINTFNTLYAQPQLIDPLQNITDTTAELSMSDYSAISGGFNLTAGGGATPIITGTKSSGVTALIINNTQINLSGLRGCTSYSSVDDLIIQFQNPFDSIRSTPVSIPAFQTIAPASPPAPNITSQVVTYPTELTNTVTIGINDYSTECGGFPISQAFLTDGTSTITANSVQGNNLIVFDNLNQGDYSSWLLYVSDGFGGNSGQTNVSFTVNYNAPQIRGGPNYDFGSGEYTISIDFSTVLGTTAPSSMTLTTSQGTYSSPALLNDNTVQYSGFVSGFDGGSNCTLAFTYNGISSQPSLPFTIQVPV